MLKIIAVTHGVSQYVQAFQVDSATLQRDMNAYVATGLSPAEQRVYSQYRSLWPQYTTVVAALSKLALAGTAQGRQAASNLYFAKAGPLNNSLDQAAAKLIKLNVGFAALDSQSLNSSASSSTMLTIVVLLLSVLFGVGLSVAVSRSIKRGVVTILDRLRSLQDHCATDLREGIDALAAGDLTISMKAVTEPIEDPANDEIGQVAQAVNGIRDRLAAMMDAYNQTRSNLSELVSSVSGSAGQVSTASRDMALTSEETGRATSEIANAVGDVAQGAERQVRMIETAKHAAEDVARAVTESAENAGKAAEVAHETRQIAQEGIGAATQANEAMRSVSDSSEATSGAMSVQAYYNGLRRIATEESGHGKIDAGGREGESVRRTTFSIGVADALSPAALLLASRGGVADCGRGSSAISARRNLSASASNWSSLSWMSCLMRSIMESPTARTRTRAASAASAPRSARARV